MDGKVRFGADYIRVMQIVSFAEGKVPKSVKSALFMQMIFLHGWGLTTKQIREAGIYYEENSSNANSEKAMDIFNRFTAHLEKDPGKAKRIVVEAAAIAFIDNDLSKDEATILTFFQNALDLKRSELEELMQDGYALANMFLEFGGSRSL